MAFLSDSKRTIQKGQQAFSPGESLLPCRGNGWQVQIAFDETAWWSVEDWGGDKDRNDWNKGGGITSAFFFNDFNAAMLGWRPSKSNIPNTWDICCYVNDEHGNARWSDHITVASRHEGEASFLNIFLERREVRFELIGYDVVKEEVVSVKGSLPWRRPWYRRYRRITPWVGGDNNSKGPWGGEAHKYMEIYTKTKRIR